MGQLNRQQWITLIATMANSALVSFFPPYDYVSLDRGNVATFSGFFLVLGNYPNHVVNNDFLALELFVIFINAGIAWLMVSKKKAAPVRRQQVWRHGVLWLIAINLIIVLLFPPFENYASVSKSVIPTFEGFYFVFSDNSQRQMVMPILYIEIALLLANAGLIMLFFKDRSREKPSPQELRAMAQRLRAQRR